MSEIVERVARALNAQRAVPLADWREWVPFARAAIAAMREPTNGMLWETRDGDSDYENWQVMIDAALDEGK